MAILNRSENRQPTKQNHPSLQWVWLKSTVLLISVLTSLVCFAQVPTQLKAPTQLKTPIQLKVPKARSSFDISHDYHIKLLEKALIKASEGRAIPDIVATFDMSQGRAMAELIKGELLDVYWLGTDTIAEHKLRAIRVPTTRGLIGYRKLIIRKESHAVFDKVNSLERLQTLVACQGTHWPDTQILKDAGLKVTTSVQYETLFKMLANRRCDYFPRGYHDYKKELELRYTLYPDLVSYDGILLHYPFAVYFFTRHENEALAKWIEVGLHALAKEGEIERFMQQHPLTAHVFPLTNENHALYLDIANSLLPEDTPYQDHTLWYQATDFGMKTSNKNQ
ncbi:hypothetical protein C2869_21270 [Saccharobesus litoralis]|uniref:Solute-binding protein family 3/N-terminal domain-containing protein n=1 Tax=Saccharobesus litoralis TaxID=2172099 RepID=A0A2S0VX76_9ALTE|nr:hypothetical protein [Saccharobesus litoralis]AWB68772.1 hypothetical protein C2869_21270 [Saccharobesus litoralis]